MLSDADRGVLMMSVALYPEIQAETARPSNSVQTPDAFFP